MCVLEVTCTPVMELTSSLSSTIILHNLLSLVVMMIAGLLAHSHTRARNGSPWEEHLQKPLYAAPRSTPLKGNERASTCEFDKGKSENPLQISQLSMAHLGGA